jgi:hypothetical protein
VRSFVCDLEGGCDGWSSSSPRMVIPTVLWWFWMNGDGTNLGLFDLELIFCLLMMNADGNGM